MPNLVQYDSRWVNQYNSFGSSSDPVARTVFGYMTRLNIRELESMYRHDWVSKAAVDAVPEDITREWMELKSDKQDKANTLDEISDHMRELDVRQKFKEAKTLARLYGGALIVLGAFDGQEISEPLIPERVQWFNFMLVLDRYQAFPQRWYNDPSHPKYGQPELYMIQPLSPGGGTKNFIIHESRMIRFDGAYAPPRVKLRNLSWGDSILESVYEPVKQFGQTTQATAALIQDFIIKKYKMKDLPEKLGAGRHDMVEQRMQLAAGSMSVHGIAVIGPEDELEKMGTPVDGLDKLQENHVDFVAGALRIPKSRLFGNQSGILGSSAAESELRNWYDVVAAEQETDITPKLERVIEVLSHAMNSPLDRKDYEVDWNSLWQYDDKTSSEIFNTYAQGYTQLVQNDILTPEEIREGVFSGDKFTFDNIVLDNKAYEAEQEAKEEQEAMWQQTQTQQTEGEDQGGEGGQPPQEE